MAGMLPGVECARRRRFHQSSGGWSDSSCASANGFTRRSSFCLYPSNYDSHHPSTTILQRNTSSRACRQHDKLGDAAREAKERLDEKLMRFQRKSEPKRANNRERVKVVMRRDVFWSKKFSWAKLGWKAAEEEDCAVCLEQLKKGETLLHLPCSHRFHSKCLSPWLNTNSHCPCCRKGIVIPS